MHVWVNASNLDQQQLLTLDVFIQRQALRIKKSYKTIGPLLERYKK